MELIPTYINYMVTFCAIWLMITQLYTIPYLNYLDISSKRKHTGRPRIGYYTTVTLKSRHKPPFKQTECTVFIHRQYCNFTALILWLHIYYCCNFLQYATTLALQYLYIRKHILSIHNTIYNFTHIIEFFNKTYDRIFKNRFSIFKNC